MQHTALPPLPNGNHARTSFISSSDDSYDQYNGHSRSASGTSQTPYDDFHISPPSKSAVREYARPDVIMNGSRRISRDYRRSLRARQSDPMAMHLLLETALGDSQHYDIMSTSELEDLRKEEQNLTRKIRARRKKLFFESRMHTTTQSLQRLDTHSRDGSLPDDAPATSPKCDELAEEVWKMEKRLAQLQDQRLKHTAGVLQLNHQLQLQGGDSGHRGLDGADDDNDAEFSFLNGFGPSPEVTSRLQGVSSTLYSMISTSRVSQNLDFPQPPAEHAAVEDELDYIERGLNTVRGIHDGLITYLEDSRTKARNYEQTTQQTNAVLGGLWEIIGAGEEDMRQNKQTGGADDSSPETDREEPNEEKEPDQPFSLQAFSGKVQKLCNQAATLSDQQLALREKLRQGGQTHERTISTLTADHASTRSKLQDMEAQLTIHSANLEAAEAERSQLEGELVRVQTQLAVSQAELDGAYGTRAQRAAEGAMQPQMKQELEGRNSELSGRIEVLERELGELVGAHEGMVRQLLEAEKDREASEGLVDGYRERLEEFERGASDDRVRLLGLKASAAPDGASSPMTPRSMDGPRAPATDSTSIGAMRQEFKRMTRELRADHFRSLKAEQEERRRLEGLVRSLRKEHGAAPSPASSAALSPPRPAKSRLSETVTAA